MQIVSSQVLYGRAQAAADRAVDPTPTRPERPRVAAHGDLDTSRSGCEMVLVHATLHGCVDALSRCGVTAADVVVGSCATPGDVGVTCLELLRAEGWLADSLAGELDADQRRALVDVYVVAENWAGDLARITSMIDATVLAARAAYGRAYARRALEPVRPACALHVVSGGIPA